MGVERSGWDADQDELALMYCPEDDEEPVQEAGASEAAKPLGPRPSWAGWGALRLLAAWVALPRGGIGQYRTRVRSVLPGRVAALPRFQVTLR